jgi:hypothetical protein
MRALRPRLVIAFDARAVTGASVSGTPSAPRVRTFARAPLGPGALVPSPAEPNLAQPEAVRDALGQVLSSLPAAGASAALIVPAGTARIAVLDVAAGVAPRDFARYRLARGLPYPSDEAVVDVLALGGGRVVAAAVRRAILQEYESLAAGAGLVQERIDLAPLAALQALLREPRDVPSVDVILGDAAVCFAAYQEGRLQAFRSRLRDPDAGEARRLADEADRTHLAAGGGAEPRLRVVGSGATALLHAWTREGRSAEPGWRAEGRLPVDPVEVAWLGGALA